MAIQYACDNCHDASAAYDSSARGQWEPPEGWWCLNETHHVDDEDQTTFRHFCSLGCLQTFLDRLSREE